MKQNKTSERYKSNNEVIFTFGTEQNFLNYHFNISNVSLNSLSR